MELRLDNAPLQQGQLSWPPHHLFFAGLFLCCHLTTAVYHLPCNALLSYAWVVALIFLCSLCFYYRMTETMSEQELDGPQEGLNCGFCLQKLPYMTEPTQLLCSHVFCLPCIQEHPKRDCPIWGWVRSSVKSEGTRRNVVPLVPESGGTCINNWNKPYFLLSRHVGYHSFYLGNYTNHSL